MLPSILTLGLCKQPRRPLISDFRPKRTVSNDDDKCVGYYSCKGFEDLSNVAAQYGTTTNVLADMNKHISGALSRGDILNVPIPCPNDKVDNDLYIDDQRYVDQGLDYINKHGSAFLAFCRMDYNCRGSFINSIYRAKSCVKTGTIDKNGNLNNPEGAAYTYYLEKLDRKPPKFSNRVFELRIYTIKLKDGNTIKHYTAYNGEEFDPGRNFIKTYGQDASYKSMYFKAD